MSSPLSTASLVPSPLPETSFTPALPEQRSPAKNITSCFHPKQRRKSLHHFADCCGSVCPPLQLFYLVHQLFWVRVSFERFEGEMSPEAVRELHQRELGRNAWRYTGESASRSSSHTPESPIKLKMLQSPNSTLPTRLLLHQERDLLRTKTQPEMACWFHLPRQPLLSGSCPIDRELEEY